LERLEGKEWVEQREQEARPKKVAVWVGRVLWVKEEEGKPGGVMGVVVVVREGRQGIQWTWTEEKGQGGGRGSRGVGCLSEKDLGRGTLEAKRGTRAQFPKGLHIWNLRPSMGSAAKIVKISENIKIKSVLWRPF
jgi:hypothetical protein